MTAQQQEERTGYLPLMQTINRYHTARQQFTLDRQSLIITGGAQQALLLILNSLLQPGDAVAFVTPSYFSASAVFSAAGVRAYTIPTTTLGLDLTALETAIIKHRIKLLILNPTLQNPTGRILPLAERQAILALCQRYQVAIVEDDVFGWLVDRDIAVPPFKALAPDNVIYISSLSKSLGSNTRIGWIVAPQAIGERIRQVQKTWI
ncbi:PLP-dependent aminotransferase family protein [Levilactobacillus brevis]|nr:PLP-dependent aminotransferase family protein [Levilactobacillus brevis]